MSTTDALHPALAALRATRDGLVTLPGDEGWDAARASFNLALDQRPVCVVQPADAREAADAVAAAAAAGRRVAAQCEGHGATSLGPLDDVVLVRTGGLGGVTIDVSARRARVGAGVRWGEVSDAAGEHGLVALAGSSRTVGVVGYTLGGGLSFLARGRGLACNRVTAIEVVTADGRVLTADERSEPDLFWALRGGGGNFGLVTALEFELFEVAEVYAGLMFFPIERASEVLHTWRDLTDTAPEELSTIARLLRIPDIPDVPPPLAGRAFAVIDVVYDGDETAGAELIAPLRELGPEMDSVATMPASELGRIHLDPEDPVPFAGEGFAVGPLPPAAIDALIAAAGPASGSVLLQVELRHTGGALAREGEGAGALATLAGEFMAYSLGIPATPEVGAMIERDLVEVAEALNEYRMGQFTNFTERAAPTGKFFPPDTVRRLEALRGVWDPDERFVARHVIGGAAPEATAA